MNITLCGAQGIHRQELSEDNEVCREATKL